MLVSMIMLKKHLCHTQKDWRCFFLANNIVEVAGISKEQIAARKAVSERKKTIFLSEVGPETYAVISNLAAPAKPKDIVLEEIFKKN